MKRFLLIIESLKNKEKAEKISASDCRQSPRFTPGLFFCSYQHSDYLPSFYQEKIPFINSKIKRCISVHGIIIL